MSVIRLVDHAPVAVSDQEELFGWLKEWTEALEGGDFGKFRSLVLILEDKDGQLATISQSLNPMDTTRLIGLLSTMIARKLSGEGDIMDLRK
jgi:hypothetical protein